MPRVIVRGLLPLLVVAAACELEEITLVAPEPVLVAEVYVDVAHDPTQNEVRAILHWTLNSDTSGLAPLDEAILTLSGPAGLEIVLARADDDECLRSEAPGEVLTCFRAFAADASLLRPGMSLEVDVSLAGGRELYGATRVPEAFELIGVPSVCRLSPDTQMEIRWTPSEGSWAYVNETSIRGLPDALRPEGIAVEDDPLYLLGLSISREDTTIVFPSEFGVFTRFDLDQDLALRLQTGLPSRTSAQVTITATDRNFVNWVRGGNFNPSGQIRIPSLEGDGTGVFASTMRNSFRLVSAPSGVSFEECPGQLD